LRRKRKINLFIFFFKATLISWENQPEVQYSILRNVGFLLEKRPELLENDVKMFFVKFNDPYYIKIEKLHILIKLCNHQNFEAVLNELREYTNELDTQFVRKTINAVGSIAIKYEKSVDK
jgi:vesicle coat complex subunit